MQTETRWYHLIAYFFGGAFLANTIPHLVAGISGSPFQSPFASPPGEGLSSAIVNVLWGLGNLVVAYLLLVRVGQFAEQGAGEPVRVQAEHPLAGRAGVPDPAVRVHHQGDVRRVLDQ